MEKYKKLNTFVEWLSQGRVFEYEDNTYSVSEQGDIIHLINSEEGVLVSSIPFIFKILDSISEGEYFLMCGEIALTKINNEKKLRRYIN